MAQIAWSMAPEILNHKFQIPNKLQIPISNDQKGLVSNLDNWDLFAIGYLEVGASLNTLRCYR